MTPAQQSLPLPVPAPGNRGGATYEPGRDFDRLNTQAADVWRAMQDGRWRSLAAIARMTGHPEASISARLRDYRKVQFGGHGVERMRDGSQFIYRLAIRKKGRDVP